MSLDAQVRGALAAHPAYSDHFIAKTFRVGVAYVAALRAGEDASPTLPATALRPRLARRAATPPPPVLDTNAARSAAARAREADILTMRAAGASLRTIRDAIGYSSVSAVSAALARNRQREEAS